MVKNFKPRPIPADYTDRFLDGDYTVGRGADPRGRTGEAAPVKKPRSKKSKKRVVRTAAE